MAGSLLLQKARYVVTCDETDSVLTDVDVLVVDGVITEIGPSLEIPYGVAVIEAGDRLVLPGLINLHTHTPMTLLRGLAEGVDLDGFLQRVWAAEGAMMSPETVELGARVAAWESLRAGVTTTLDMYLFPEDAHRGAAAAGLRHIGGPIFFDGAGPDGLTWQQRIERAASWAATLAEVGGPTVPTALMPHGTYTNSPAHLAEIAELAADFDLVHVHVSETAAENAGLAARYGQTPTALLAASGLLEHRTVFGHGVHLTEDDLRLIEGRDVAVAHCPGSNLKLNSGALHWEGLRDKGIQIGLGTDGCASSNDLDLWPVLRQTALLARLTADSPLAGDATAVLRAATIDGARALGLDEQLGSIEVGKRADLVLLDLDAPHLVPVLDVPALLVFAAGRGDVTDVFVDGDWVIADRLSTRVDERATLAAAREAGARAAAALG